MAFKRIWDLTCPRVWDQWEVDGVKWVIQDLPPEDEDEALEMLRLYTTTNATMIPDNVINSSSGVSKDPISERNLLGLWHSYMQHRMSLACYAEMNGIRKLVGLNVCYVRDASIFKKEKDAQVEGKALANIFGALMYLDGKLDLFKYLGYDSYLSSVALVVRREFRGAKLGSRLLSAREPLCRAFNIKATATIFTGESSQTSATRAGFGAVVVVPLSELAEAGLNFPKDGRALKIMVKRFE